MSMVAENIKWNYEGCEDIGIILPTSVDIPENITEDEVSDYLSDLTGFCHDGYVLEKD